MTHPFVRAGFIALLLACAPASAQVLGTASNFAVLAGSTVTNTGATLVTGNVGVYAGSAITGFPPGMIVPGTGFLHSADVVAQQAQGDNLTAFGSLGSLASSGAIGPALDDVSRGGLPLNPGVWDAGAADLTGTLTLNGPGLYVIRTTSSLNIAVGSIVNLNGASPCDVWWQVGSSAVINSGAAMAGNILALTSISIGSGATLQGRALVQTGAVTLNDNAVTACSGGTAPGFIVPPIVAVAPITAGGIPTLSEWAMILLASMMVVMAGVVLSRRA